MNIGQSFSTAWTYEGKKTICKITYFFQIAKEGSEELYTKQFSAKGISICSPADKYDKEFGKTLASARARQKIERKLEKELIKYSFKDCNKGVFLKDGEVCFKLSYLLKILEDSFGKRKLSVLDQALFAELKTTFARRYTNE